MSNLLKIAALPHPIVFAEPESNLIDIAQSLEHIPENTDIIVLPEMFTTGYVKDKELVRSLGERNDGRTISAVRRWASTLNAAIAGSFLATDGTEYYNRAFFVESSGETTFYDKKHLFTPSGEADIYTPGRQRFSPIRFRGWNVMLFVCYDLRFPIWCRNDQLEYDLAILPSNWAEARQYAFTQLLIARAIENQACYVGANRGGEDLYGKYPSSMTQIYDFWGDPAGHSENGFIVGILDKEKMEAYRKRFPVFRDADPVKR